MTKCQSAFGVDGLMGSHYFQISMLINLIMSFIWKYTHNADWLSQKYSTNSRTKLSELRYISVLSQHFMLWMWIAGQKISTITF